MKQPFITYNVVILALSLIVSLLSGLTSDIFSQSVELEGMLGGWITASHNQKLNAQTGLRYIPELSAGYQINEQLMLDGEFSVNTWGTSTFWSDDSIDLDGKIKPYRMWLRFSGDQFEIRAGLQKINFGSATLLRPLMWFDRIDPRDPLQLTDGVYGLLGRYYFLNNANIWIWGLYGNKETKGWEMFPSGKPWIEYGGRIQAPFYTGEIAVSFHHRRADMSLNDTNQTTSLDKVPESRIALDGKWDLEIGLWFETSLVYKNLDDLLLPSFESMIRNFNRYLNVGMDYTFNLGNGLNMMTEFLSYSISDEIFGNGEGVSFSAISVNYPLSIINNLHAIVFYDWNNRDIYNFINWSWQFDRWSIYLMGFWNPERFQVFPGMDEVNLFAGKGIQIMAVFNH